MGIQLFFRKVNVDGEGLQIFAGNTLPPVASATIWDMDKPVPYLSGLYIDEPYRRQGIARAILRNAVAACRECGKDSLALWVKESNLPAIRLYRSSGFLVASSPNANKDVMMIHPLYSCAASPVSAGV